MARVQLGPGGAERELLRHRETLGPRWCRRRQAAVEERRLYEELKRVSKFDPRANRQGAKGGDDG